MRTLTDGDLEGLLVWVREGGFPGEVRDEDLVKARGLLSGSPETERVLLASGGAEFSLIDADSVERVGLPETADGLDSDYALGAGDGGTLPGIPVGWALLRFVCPRGDTTVLLPRYPAQPPHCPEHHISLVFQPDE